MKDPEWFDVMLDLETMGLPPTGAIVGIGACFFDLHKCAIGPTFYQAVNLATSARAGMTMDPGTVMWWLGQGDEARRSIMWNTVALDVALCDLNEWMQQHTRPRDCRVWGNAPSFDMSLLRFAFGACGMDTPWHYTNERDFRTVRAMYPKVEYNTDDKGTDAHNAMHDAVFQANHLIKIRNRNA